MKVQCPSCGGTGIIRHSEWKWLTRKHHQCRKCNGFGFILMDSTEFAERKSDARRYGRSTHLIAFGECQEFTGLVKVRNIQYVFIQGRDFVPYGVFYKEHRNSR